MERGHFHKCRLQGDISLTELLSSLILFDASGCNELLLKTTSASGDLQLTGFSSNSEHMYYRLHTVWKFHMELGHCICFTALEPYQKRVRRTLPECFRTTKRLYPISVTGFSNAVVSWPNVFWKLHFVPFQWLLHIYVRVRDTFCYYLETTTLQTFNPLHVNGEFNWLCSC